MTGQNKIKGGISNISIGFGKGTENESAPVSPPPPFRVLIAGDFGLVPDSSVLNITGLDVEEILEANTPEFTIRTPNSLGSHPSELEESIAFAKVDDLRPSAISESFAFRREIAAAGTIPERLAAHGQRYDKVATMLATGAEMPTQGGDTQTPSAGPGQEADGLEALFSMANAPGRSDKPTDSSDVAKAAVDAFVRKTLQEESEDFSKAAAPEDVSPLTKLVDSQSRLFFGEERLRTVIENWHSLNFLVSELSPSLPFELHLLQVGHDLQPQELANLIGGEDGALLGELYDVALFTNRAGVYGRDAELLTVITRECAASDTVGLIALKDGFAGVPGDELAATEAADQLFEKPGFQIFQGLRSTDAASYVALFWNDARLTSEHTAYPAIFTSAAWIALARILAQLESETFPYLPAGVPHDFDALEVEESHSTGTAAATAARFHAGPGVAVALAQCGINVLEGLANRTSLVFQREVTLKPGEEGRGSLDQALLVSRLFSLFQDALGSAVSPGQTANARAEAIAANLGDLSRSLSGHVDFQLQRVHAKDQDLIKVSATVQAGWAEGQSHSFYLPAEDG